MLILAGGISFLSARKGFVCDNVLDYEIVLPSGDIVHANAQEKLDLFKALRGGSNNFGIVTNFKLVVFPYDFQQLYAKVFVGGSSVMETHIQRGSEIMEASNPHVHVMLCMSCSLEHDRSESSMLAGVTHTSGGDPPLFAQFLGDLEKDGVQLELDKLNEFFSPPNVR